MRAYLKKNGTRVLTVLLIAVLFISLGRFLMAGRAGFLANATASVSIPVRRAAMALTEWFEDIYGYMYRYADLEAENRALRAQLAETQEQLRQAIDANEENERLRRLLSLREKHAGFVFESAKIISWNASNWTSSFTISKGSDHGIDLSDCVVTEYGALVGQIIELGDTWSTVRSVIDVDMSVGALVGEAGNAAMIVGDYSLMQRGLTKLTYLTEGVNLLPGDTILTSGKGGMFPQGLVIGTISAVESEAGVPYGAIEPGCDLDSLAQVFVIKEFDIAE